MLNSQVIKRQISTQISTHRHRQTQKRPIKSGVLRIGAGNETRTRDPNLGKVVLYQLSYSRKWRPVGDSNPCYRRERAVS